MVLSMVIFAALLLWLLLVLFGGWWLTRLAEPVSEAPRPPRDPIAEEVGKWMHDWERGRA